ncbi:MAG TPA: FkbM family methyltransferase [Verrucomicrobiae bacterium]|nr:FkbM family methyltransferase [Verrucomicrobiae bacterium]
MSTALRTRWLALLRVLGISHFTAKSSLGHPFVCHVGDFLGENPFYNRTAFHVELTVCAACLHQENAPVILDVGANVGYWSSQLAQLLAARRPKIYAFEPVPSTFAKLMKSVETLDLAHTVIAIPAAVRDRSGPVAISYAPWDSLLAQVVKEKPNIRVGNRIAYAASTTLDDFCRTFDIVPSLIKVDVEGSEVDVLKGATSLLKGPAPPYVAFEFNPLTLSEMGHKGRDIEELLEGYALHYVDDFESQRHPVGMPLQSLDGIDWVCNVIAVPKRAVGRWDAAASMASRPQW